MKSVRIKWDDSRSRALLKASGERGLYAAAQVIAAESSKQVPLDQATLLRSQAVSVDGDTAAISYDTPYAVRWHEEDANFQRGRKKKYLEDPINDKSVIDAAIGALRDNIEVD